MSALSQLTFSKGLEIEVLFELAGGRELREVDRTGHSRLQSTRVGGPPGNQDDGDDRAICQTIVPARPRSRVPLGTRFLPIYRKNDRPRIPSVQNEPRKSLELLSKSEYPPRQASTQKYQMYLPSFEIAEVTLPGRYGEYGSSSSREEVKHSKL